MPDLLQEFLAAATIKAAADLEAALLNLPEEKRDWKPTEQSRSALDQVAECAIMNNSTIDMIRSQIFPEDWAHIYYQKQIAELCTDWPTLRALLHENAVRVADVIRTLSDEGWGKQAELADTFSYPYWNMTYHTGQINYIASLL